MPPRFSILFSRIDVELSNDPSMKLNDLARVLGVGRHYVERAISDISGASFRDFRKERRLKRARQLLKNGLLIKEVAGKLGYRSSKAFSRFIRTATGSAPSSMRHDIGDAPQMLPPLPQMQPQDH